MIAGMVVVVSAVASGIIHKLVSFSAPRLGPVSLEDLETAGVIVPGIFATSVRSISSDGTADVIVTFFPEGVLPGASIDVYASAVKCG
jgi:hypothetical protein